MYYLVISLLYNSVAGLLTVLVLGKRENVFRRRKHPLVCAVVFMPALVFLNVRLTIAGCFFDGMLVGDHVFLALLYSVVLSVFLTGAFLWALAYASTKSIPVSIVVFVVGIALAALISLLTFWYYLFLDMSLEFAGEDTYDHGLTYYENGEYETARELFKEQSNKDRRNSDGYYYLSLVYWRTGESEKSLEYFDIAVRKGKLHGRIACDRFEALHDFHELVESDSGYRKIMRRRKACRFENSDVWEGAGDGE